MSTIDFGSRYFVAEVHRSVSADGFISIMADGIEVSASGDLIFKCHGKDGSELVGLVLARSQWTTCFAASMIDGQPVAVEQWAQGERKWIKRNMDVEREKEKLTPTLRYKVLERDGFKCVVCGRSQGDSVKLHVDHYIPLSKGGRTELKNLRTLCAECNHGKAGRMPLSEETLRGQPAPAQGQE